jgi:hypothetical protein
VGSSPIASTAKEQVTDLNLAPIEAAGLPDARNVAFRVANARPCSLWPLAQPGAIRTAGGRRRGGRGVVAGPSPHPQCASFSQCVALLHAGPKSIDDEGVTGDLDFNRYHNVFGPVAVVHANAKCEPVVVATYSATLLAHHTNQ